MQIESYSSIAYRIALVAAGRHDAMVSLTTKRDWDLAAADLVIWESGGKLTGAEGQTLLYNQPAAAQRATIAAGRRLHAALLAAFAPMRQK
jgi:myo-inositol-1(or 4)-monophosphatase